jgi:CBS domain containing-hemolysin-like protein
VSVGYLAIAVGLILVNAFFVAVEFALVTSRRERLEPKAAAGSRSAQVALAAMRELSLQLAGAQLGITMSSLVLGFVAEPAVAHLVEGPLTSIGLPEGAVDPVALAIALTLTAFVHLVIGEMVPKNLAIAEPERTLLVLALPNRLYVMMFRPAIRFFNYLANAGVRLFGVEPKEELAAAHTPEELYVLLASSKEDGVLEEFEHELLAGALGFADRPVVDAIVPRDEIDAVPLRASVADVERLVHERGHSRVPVMGRDLDDLVGFIHVKDLLSIDTDRHAPLPVRIIRRMLVVRDNLTLAEVLLRMQRGRLHLAVVVDEEGHTLGMVSLEDILEELVGDIRDESDPADPAIDRP